MKVKFWTMLLTATWLIVGFGDTQAGASQSEQVQQGDLNPAWSVDGLHIAFTSDRTGNREVWIADSDGNSSVQLTDQTIRGNKWLPKWSANGYIAFITAESPFASRSNIWFIDETGSESSNVTAGMDGWVGSFNWSPDGTKIAFDYRESTDAEGLLPFTGTLYVYDVDSGTLTDLFPDCDCVIENPVWSHQGDLLAYLFGSRYELKGTSIAVFDIDTQQIIASSGWNIYYRMAWSPDDSQIVAERNGEIVLFTNRLENETVLLDGLQSHALKQPQFVPNGTNTISVSVVMGVSENFEPRFAFGLIQNSQLVLLDQWHDLASPEYMWSPNGTELVFTQLEETGATTIWITDINEETARQIE